MGAEDQRDWPLSADLVLPVRSGTSVAPGGHRALPRLGATRWSIRRGRNPMSSTPLPKIALEEAYEHPDNVARTLASEEALARVADGGGVMPSYLRPVQERLREFDDVRLGSMDAAGVEHS